MGLDTVITAFFIVGTILFVAGTVTMGTSNLFESFYDGYVAIQDTTLERLHTDIEITDLWTSNVTNHTCLMVTNTGETKLSDFELWDILLIKDDQVFYLSKDSYQISLENDLLNPNILDPHENLEVELPDVFDPGDQFIIKVITENGVASSAEYVVPG